MKEETCSTCAWYAEFEGVCTNRDSEYCADWPPEPEERGRRFWESIFPQDTNTKSKEG